MISPSHTLWIELTTRITTRRLHFRSGDEETAVTSVSSLFKKTRVLMEANPADADFLRVAEKMLNQTLWPYTARWHGWLTPDPKLKDRDGQPTMKFRDPQVRREFRRELRKLQPTLLGYSKAFDLLRQGIAADADGRSVDDWISESAETIDILAKEMVKGDKPADLGPSFPLGIQSQVNVYTKFAASVDSAEIEKMEFSFVRARRGEEGNEPIFDGAGLALSGGGIKSATFCLGVVQELAKRGILKQMDYLSTVSGGGYLGTFISAYLGSPIEPMPEENKSTPEKRIKEAFEPELSGRESKAVRHLRNHSKYLLNGGIWGKLNIAGLLASGVLTNLLMILPIPLMVAILIALLGRGGFWIVGNDHPSFACKLLTILGGCTALFWIILPVVQRLSQRAKLKGKGSRIRSILEFATLGLALCTTLASLLFVYPYIQDFYFQIGAFFQKYLNSPALSSNLVTVLTGLSPIIFGAGGFLIKNPKLQRFAMKLFILSGPLFYACLILFLTSKMGLEKTSGVWEIKYVFLTMAGLLAWSVFGVNINMVAPHRYYRSRLCECYLVKPGKPEVTAWDKFIGYFWRGYDPAHDFDFGAVRDLKLSETGESRVAPYHLLNAFVNLPASRNRNLRGRKGDFFMFSRDVCGSPSTGYVKTKELEKADPRLDLGTAMAISGAAANSNMGWRSMVNFRFIMTLLNVRLGYWVPNFRTWKKDSSGRLKTKSSSVGSPYLLAEMGGRIQENMNFLNLSDGGHIENLGAYELLRRRCKFIISVDGGGSRDIHGGDLQRLERYASIDFGIEMKYDLTEMQTDEDGITRTQAILVKVLYPARILGSNVVSKIRKDIGWMIYLRPGITGIEPTYLLDHWRTNPLFPFESLMEQFFSEEQFEGYRCLGQNAAESLFQEDIGTDCKPQVKELFQQVATHFLVDNDDAFHKTTPFLDSKNLKSTLAATHSGS